MKKSSLKPERAGVNGPRLPGLSLLPRFVMAAESLSREYDLAAQIPLFPDSFMVDLPLVMK